MDAAMGNDRRYSGGELQRTLIESCSQQTRKPGLAPGFFFLSIPRAINSKVDLRKDVVPPFDLGKQRFVDLAGLEHFC